MCGWGGDVVVVVVLISRAVVLSRGYLPAIW